MIQEQHTGHLRLPLLLTCALPLVAASCSLATPRTLEEYRQGWSCIEYKDHLPWLAVESALGRPDVYPLPSPRGDLSQNTRLYEERIVVAYVERQEVQEGDRRRFAEFVTKLEVCRPK